LNQFLERDSSIQSILQTGLISKDLIQSSLFLLGADQNILLFLQNLQKLLNGKDTQFLLLIPNSNIDIAGLLFLVSDNKNIVKLLQLSISDFLVQSAVSLVHVNVIPLGLELLLNLKSVLLMLLRNWNN
jgi:hypothetical protein